MTVTMERNSTDMVKRVESRINSSKRRKEGWGGLTLKTNCRNESSACLLLTLNIVILSQNNSET